ncbi:uncharacterized protein LOC113560035 [Rhopalosiphum maidis]|uniref:uncharacterized protein LOC113560035 n=1 Tax=Rhopalosiphum maidis TaxID=43146 RepID=UPI000F00FD0D|nr:uncharacterized protein LOC113560035 [Rhopalosiphum maidis]
MKTVEMIKNISTSISQQNDNYFYDEVACKLLNNILEDFKTCAKLSVLHNFYKCIRKYECDVYTKHGDYIFNSIILNEFKNLLSKINKDEYEDFSIYKLHYVDLCDTVMVDVGKTFIKLYMDQEIFTYREFGFEDILVIGSILRKQFQTN